MPLGLGVASLQKSKPHRAKLQSHQILVAPIDDRMAILSAGGANCGHTAQTPVTARLPARPCADH